VHRTTRAPVAERLACERERMRALPCKLPDPDRRWVARVAPQSWKSTIERGNSGRGIQSSYEPLQTERTGYALRVL